METVWRHGKNKTETYFGQNEDKGEAAIARYKLKTWQGYVG